MVWRLWQDNHPKAWARFVVAFTRLLFPRGAAAETARPGE
jgi:hypothetical protein